jgi:hypothetical protein
VAIKDALELRRRQEVAELGLGEHALERALIELGGQIERGPCRRGERDPEPPPDVARIETASVVDPYSGAALHAARGHGDVDRAARRRANTPDPRDGLVAQERALAAGEDGRDLAPEAGRGTMSDEVHASVQAVEVPPSDPAGDRAASEAAGVELRGRHHAVLARREGGDGRVAPATGGVHNPVRVRRGAARAGLVTILVSNPAGVRDRAEWAGFCTLRAGHGRSVPRRLPLWGTARELSHTCRSPVAL